MRQDVIIGRCGVNEQERKDCGMNSGENTGLCKAEAWKYYSSFPAEFPCGLRKITAHFSYL